MIHRSRYGKDRFSPKRQARRNKYRQSQDWKDFIKEARQERNSGKFLSYKKNKKLFRLAILSRWYFQPWRNNARDIWWRAKWECLNLKDCYRTGHWDYTHCVHVVKNGIKIG